jgi:hypothetical protein
MSVGKPVPIMSGYPISFPISGGTIRPQKEVKGPDGLLELEGPSPALSMVAMGLPENSWQHLWKALNIALTNLHKKATGIPYAPEHYEFRIARGVTWRMPNTKTYLTSHNLDWQGMWVLNQEMCTHRLLMGLDFQPIRVWDVIQKLHKLLYWLDGYPQKQPPDLRNPKLKSQEQALEMVCAWLVIELMAL